MFRDLCIITISCRFHASDQLQLFHIWMHRFRSTYKLCWDPIKSWSLSTFQHYHCLLSFQYFLWICQGDIVFIVYAGLIRVSYSSICAHSFPNQAFLSAYHSLNLSFQPVVFYVVALLLCFSLFDCHINYLIIYPRLRLLPLSYYICGRLYPNVLQCPPVFIGCTAFITMSKKGLKPIFSFNSERGFHIICLAEQYYCSARRFRSNRSGISSVFLTLRAFRRILTSTRLWSESPSDKT